MAFDSLAVHATVRFRDVSSRLRPGRDGAGAPGRTRPALTQCERRVQPRALRAKFEISFCASTANSIGSSCSTSLTKPLTISAIASSSRKPALQAVEQLVVGNLRRRRLVLELRAGVLRLDIGHRMRAALVADQQRVALGEVARVRRLAVRRDLAAIGVVASGRPRCPWR